MSDARTGTAVILNHDKMISLTQRLLHAVDIGRLVAPPVQNGNAVD
jgi:hypothetical protein